MSQATLPIGKTDLEQRYARALQARDRLLARVTFWDQHRSWLMLPLIAVGAVLGALLCLAVRPLTRLPDQAEAYGAVVGILVTGRAVTSYFDVRKLEVARRRVEMLTQELASIRRR